MFALGGPRKQVKLPESKEDKSAIRFLKVGESAYTVPWAVWVDADRNVWMNVNMSAHRHPGGTVQMKVTRAEDGWETSGSGKYAVGDLYGVVSSPRWEPVVKLK